MKRVLTELIYFWKAEQRNASVTGEEAELELFVLFVVGFITHALTYGQQNVACSCLTNKCLHTCVHVRTYEHSYLCKQSATSSSTPKPHTFLQKESEI